MTISMPRYRYVDMGLCESVSQADYDNAPRLIASNYFTVRGGSNSSYLLDISNLINSVPHTA